MCTAYHSAEIPLTIEIVIRKTIMRDTSCCFALIIVKTAATTRPRYARYCDAWYINHIPE